MNEFEPISCGQIDRLVDGELPRDERRAVLLALDHEEGGWRRLALAFLESQAMRESLRGRSKSSVTTNAVSATTVPSVPVQTAKRPSRSWSTVGVVAASAMLMFGLGRLSMPQTSQVSPSQRIPSVEATYDPPARDAAVGSDKEILVSNTGSTVQQQTLRLELGDGQGGPTQAVEVPMVDNSDIRPEDLLAAPPMISDSVQRELLRSGKRAYEQRQLYEVTLEDGRRGVMPVSNVYVENAGWDAYQ